MVMVWLAAMPLLSAQTFHVIYHFSGSKPKTGQVCGQMAERGFPQTPTGQPTAEAGFRHMLIG
jgi:hypothetical protein